MPPVGLLTPVTVGEYSRGTAAHIGALSTAALLIGLPLSDIAYGEGVGYHLVVTLFGAAVVLAAAWMVPWDNMSPRFLLVWPVLVLVSILVWSAAGPDTAQLFLSFISLSFLYVGVTQPPGTALVLIAPAAVTWWSVMAVQELPTSQALVRVTFATIVWLLIAEVPAWLLQRLHGMQVQLAVRAGTDALTGLSNRFDLPRALSAQLPGDCLVLLDLDHFKEFNDEHGHQAGDLVLADFGAFIGRTVRSSDLAFRYGGEEFLLLLSQTTARDAQHLVDRASKAWTRRTQLTFSAGIALATKQGDEDALKLADAALYAAKAAGRATSRVHVPD